MPTTGALSAAQALARANAEIAARGLVVTVVQAYYGLEAAQAKVDSMQAANDEAQRFLELSRKFEQGGEVAHSDVIKAQIQANDQQRALQDTQLAAQNARLNLAVLLFPNFFQDFTLADDLERGRSVAADDRGAAIGGEEQSRAAGRLRRDGRRQPRSRGGAGGTSSDAGSGLLLRHRRQPVRDIQRRHSQSGYAATATLNIPVWHWGAIESRVKQAELQQHQAKVELSAAQRQAVADLQSFYGEAQTSRSASSTFYRIPSTWLPRACG